MLSPFFSTSTILDDPFFNTSFGRGRRGSQSDLMNYNEFNPTVDVKETPEAITLHCELAGVPMENLSLDYKDERLTISGRKDERKEDKDKGMLA
jgi:HSP20 family molecular chaperone IbpA